MLSVIAPVFDLVKLDPEKQEASICPLVLINALNEYPETELFILIIVLVEEETSGIFNQKDIPTYPCPSTDVNYV